MLVPPAPKKGLITDLDDTFWSGLVGEVGADKVCWDLANHAQVHGLYQQVLRALIRAYSSRLRARTARKLSRMHWNEPIC